MLPCLTVNLDQPERLDERLDESQRAHAVVTQPTPRHGDPYERWLGDFR